MEASMTVSRNLSKLAIAALIGLGVAGCVYEPAPQYAYAPAPAYGYYYAPAPAYYGPSVALGFGFHDGWHRRWR
jgi:hypothetical protein